jgi:hypothetical protein
VLLIRATRLGDGRSEEDVVIPAIGRRVTHPLRPVGPTGGEA